MPDKTPNPYISRKTMMAELAKRDFEIRNYRWLCFGLTLLSGAMMVLNVFGS